MLDPAADLGRRAWAPCPRCTNHRRCRPCGSGRSCPDHWRYLLAADGRTVFLQCPGCLHRLWHDTGFGAGDRPDGVVDLPDFPSVA